MMHPILYVDLFRQSSYKNSVLISLMHKQRTYFSKKYSKINKITLNKINRLSKVCEKDNIKIVKYIKKKTYIIEYNNFVFSNSKYGCVRVVRYILNNGFDVNKKINFNYSSYVLLTYCSQYGYIEVVKLLLEKGANIHADDDYALRWSARNEHIEVVKLLLEKGANIHADNDYALRWSAKNGHIEVVKLLLEKGANIHADDDYALRLSACYGQIEVVKYLLEKGANIRAQDDDALRYSAKYEHIKVFIRKRGLYTC